MPEIRDLPRWLDPLVSRLTPGQRRGFLARLGRTLAAAARRRIAAQRAPDGAPFAPRLPRKGRLRTSGPMFRRLRAPGRLRHQASADRLEVGFGGGDARLARIHSEGLVDAVEPGGPRVRYTARPLLGWSQADAAAIQEAIARDLFPPR